ncbi:MAG TPA: hypothetical protein H9805_12730 [Candidatus Janibacter merdipullorum]|nr:hypothetical protein [Candidatus Janibacter merdipullorum]
MLGPTALAAAALLVVAGVPKVADPGDLVRALRSTGLRVPPLLVRGFALAEVLAGGAAILLPGRPAFAAVALLHAGFTAFVLRALGRGGVVASCGCFGRADTPPTRSHAAVTALLALAASGVAISPPTDPWWTTGIAPSAITPLLAGLIAFLAWQVMAVLPSTTPAAIRSTGRA